MPKNKKKGDKKGGGNKSPWFLQPLMGKQLKKETKYQTRQEFGPVTKQAKAERRASAYREKTELPSWYGQYKNDLAQLQQGSQQAYGQALGSIQNFSLAAGQQDAANRNSIQAQIAADAARRGGTVDPSINIGGANAEAARLALQQSVHGTVAGQGANQSSYLANRQGVAGQAQLEAQEREYLRRRTIDQDLRDIAKEKGMFKNEIRRNARESERKFYLENKALKGDRRGDKTQLAVAKQNAKPNVSIVKYPNGQGGGGGKDKGGYSPREAKALIGDAKPAVRGDASKLASYLMRRGVDEGIARRVARRYVRNHGGGGGPHGPGSYGHTN